MTAKICIVYYSATGNIAALANALGESAAEAGAEVRLRRVAETAPEDAIAYNPAWVEFSKVYAETPLATLADLEWADGLAFGAPTRFGAPAAQLRNFLDTTGGLWAKGALASKVATSFTSASTEHGGLESTILALNNTFYHWGSLIMPLGYGDPHVLKQSGNPYGATFMSRGGASVDEVALGAARVQGRRLTDIAGRLAASA